MKQLDKWQITQTQRATNRPTTAPYPHPFSSVQTSRLGRMLTHQLSPCLLAASWCKTPSHSPRSNSYRSGQELTGSYVQSLGRLIIRYAVNYDGITKGSALGAVVIRLLFVLCADSAPVTSQHWVAKFIVVLMGFSGRGFRNKSQSSSEAHNRELITQ